MQSYRATTAAIGRWLQRKHEQDQANEAVQVNIREFIVTHPEDVYGEFDGGSGALTKDFYDLPGETFDHLIDRMVAHIREAATGAAAVHLNENFIVIPVKNQVTGFFTPQYQLRDDKRNEITCVSFSEFYFYPHYDRGPFSWHAFNKLVTKLTELAESYPVNFHFILGTFPVKDVANQSHNICVYLQCGKDARVNVFAKSMPHYQDKQYPGTVLPLMTSGSLAESCIAEIRNWKFILSSSIAHNKYSMIQKNIEGFKNACLAHQGYIFENSTSSDKIYLKELQALLDYIKNLKNKFAITMARGHQECLELVSHLNVLTDRYVDVLISRQSKMVKTVKGQIQKKKISSFQLSHGDQGISSLQYGGYIECQTAGGIQFTRLIEICFDHHFGVAKSLFENRIKQQMISFSGRIVPLVSHVIVSNTVGLNEEYCLVDTVVRVDPASYGVVHRGDKSKNARWQTAVGQSKMYQSVLFGKRYYIHAYKPVAVPRLRSHQMKLVHDYHQLLDQITQLKLLQEQSPKDQAIARDINSVKLLLMCRLGEVDAVADLLDQGADIYFRDSSGCSAANHGIHHRAIIKLLLAREVNLDAEIKRAIHHHSPALKVLYQVLAEQQQSKKIVTLVNDGSSRRAKRILIEAAIKAKRSVDVEYLLSIGADPLLKNSKGQSPLMKIFRYHDEEVLKLIYNHLSENGYVDAIVRLINHDTPQIIRQEVITLAIANHDEKVVHYLMNGPLDIMALLYSTVTEIIVAGLSWEDTHILADMYQALSRFDQSEKLISWINEETADRVKAILLSKALEVGDFNDVKQLVSVGADPAFSGRVENVTTMRYWSAPITQAANLLNTAALKFFYDHMQKSQRGLEFVKMLPANLPSLVANDILSYLKTEEEKTLLTTKVGEAPRYQRHRH